MKLTRKQAKLVAGFGLVGATAFAVSPVCGVLIAGKMVSAAWFVCGTAVGFIANSK